MTGGGEEAADGGSSAVRLAGLADMDVSSSSFFSGPAARLLVEEQAGLLHLLVEFGRSCAGSQDEVFTVLLGLDVILGCEGLVDPVVDVHQASCYDAFLDHTCHLVGGSAGLFEVLSDEVGDRREVHAGWLGRHRVARCHVWIDNDAFLVEDGFHLRGQ